MIEHIMSYFMFVLADYKEGFMSGWHTKNAHARVRAGVLFKD